MPQVIGEALIAYGLEAGVAGAIEAGAWFVANSGVISTVGALAITSAQASAQRRKARDAYNAAQQDRHITLRSATSARREVLGRAVTGGDLLWAASTGTDKTKLVMIIALSAREIDGVEQVFYDGQPLELDANGYAQSGPFVDTAQVGINKRNRENATKSGTVTTSGGTVVLDHTPVAGSVFVFTQAAYDAAAGATDLQSLPYTLAGVTVTVGASTYSGPVVVQYQYPLADQSLRILIHTGGAGQAVDPVVQALFPTDWDASHRLDGVAYAAVLAEYNTTSFPQGLKGISFLVRGSKVYDPRTGTTSWSDNPALLQRHVCQSPLDPALRPIPVDDTWCASAATVCDQTVSYTIGSASKTRKRYVAGTVYSEAEPPKKCLDELAQAMAGGWVFAAGAMRMRAGAYATPVMTLTEVDFAGGAVDVTPHLPREQLVNVANAKAFDPDNRWQYVDVPEVRSSAYIAEDGGALPPLQVDMGAVYDMAQAQQILAVMLREARLSTTIKATFRMRAYPIEVFDVVNLRLAKYFGATPLAMLVLARRWVMPEPGANDFGIELTMRATSAAVYADGTVFDQPLLPPANRLPLPWQVQMPGALSIDSNPTTVGDATQTSRMVVTWPAMTDAGVLNSGSVEVQYWPADQALPAGDWMSSRVAGRATQLEIRGVQQRRWYLVRARGWIGPACSAWGVQVAHQVQAAAPISSQYTGALDAAVYGGGYTTAMPGQYAWTAPRSGRAYVTGNCVISATGDATSSATKTSVAVKEAGGLTPSAVTGTTGLIRLRPPSGEINTLGYSQTASFVVVAGVTYTFGLYYSDSSSASAPYPLSTNLTSAQIVIRLES
jgi:hypothetical protein